jgi:hypothetical protein
VTDQQLADRIFQARRQLITAIEDAEHAGLVVQVEVSPGAEITTSAADVFRNPEVTVRRLYTDEEPF